MANFLVSITIHINCNSNLKNNIQTKKLNFTHAIIKKQGKKFTCNVTLWYIHITTVTEEMQQWVFVYCWDKYATLKNIKDIKSYCHENNIMLSLCTVETHSAVHRIGCCPGNVTIDSHYTVKIQNILYRCQQYKHTEVFMWSAWYFCLDVTKYGFPWDF
jgi:hypothetical protein